MSGTKKVTQIQDELDSLLSDLNKESAVDTTRQSEEELKTDTSHKEQNNIGNEQSQEASDTGSTVDKEQGKKKKRDEVGEEAGANMGTKQMDIDTKAENASNVMGKITKNDKTAQEKMARAVELGEGIVGLLDNLQEAPQVDKQAGQEQELIVPEGLDKNQFMGLVKTANDQASDYFSQYLHGMVKRAQDREAIKALELDKNTLTKLGGVDGILDKLAEENPEAVLPPEVLKEMPSQEAPVEAPMPPPPAPEEEAPVEGAPEGEEAEMDAIAEAMASLGVTPEILEQAMALIEDLKAQGYNDEQIAEAAAEMLQEQAVEAPVEEAPAEEAPVEAPVEEAPAEEAPVEAPVDGAPEGEELPGEKIAMQKVMSKLRQKTASQGSVKKIREAIQRKARG